MRGLSTALVMGVMLAACGAPAPAGPPAPPEAGISEEVQVYRSPG